jgi:hypothetical protein
MIRGKWYWISLVDIQAELLGDVEKAEPYFRRFPARFHSWDEKTVWGHAVKFARFAMLEEEEPDNYNEAGWWAVPADLILSHVEVEEPDAGVYSPV